MRLLHFRRFTKPSSLRRAGRSLLQRFFANFALPLRDAGFSLPDESLPDTAYFDALAGLLLTPEGLPDSLIEALFAINEMATGEGQERLEQAVVAGGLHLDLAPNSTHLDIALQVWLVAPELLAAQHNEQRMLRLARFEFFSSSLPLSRRLPFTAPPVETLPQLTAALDRWFARHQRGQNTTRVELHRMDGELWFLIRHGDTFARAAKVEPHGPEILHFRPQRDDVVVYNPEHDELRINASLKGERDLYREQFGSFLRGDGDYFNSRQAYSLEPLRHLGADALRAEGIPGIQRIRLRELEIVSDNPQGEFKVLGARDLFDRDSDRDGTPVIPRQGRLASACFEVQFDGSDKPRPVRVCPPNVLKLGRHCDSRALNTWLRRVEMRVPAAA